MESKYFFIDLSIYIEAIPCIIGFYHWRFLTMPLKTYFIFFSIVRTLGITSILLANYGINNHFVYPAISLINGVGYGLLFQQLFHKRFVRIVLGLLFAAFLIVTIYVRLNSKVLNLESDIFLNILCITCSGILLKRLIFERISFRREPIFWVLLTIFIVFTYSILLSTIGGKVLLYLSDYWQNIFWLWINPVINFIRASFISYAFYLARRQRFNLEKIPDLEQEP